MKLHLHDWSRWSAPIDSITSDYAKCQCRECNTCGKVQMAKIKQPWNWWVSAKAITDAIRERTAALDGEIK